MIQRQIRGLCPGSGEKRILFKRDSGIRPYNQRQNISAGTRMTSAMTGFRMIDSSSMPQV